ncbi:hypothetical protein BDQ17DRAFT_1364488 [Cyathus striatus]|nr:hypothetical protein BDQ17DRAFT_1364488 [Cyathus striatus]
MFTKLVSLLASSIIADGTHLEIGPIKEKPWTYFADATITSGNALPPSLLKSLDGQRGQFRTPLVPADGSKYFASWTSNIPLAGVDLFGDEGFHLFELYSSDIGAFSYVAIPDGTFTVCLADHRKNGIIDFNVTDKVTGERLLTFLYHGQVGGKDVSFHVGSTRTSPVKGQTQFVENVGQFVYEKRH